MYGFLLSLALDLAMRRVRPSAPGTPESVDAIREIIGAFRLGVRGGARRWRGPRMLEAEAAVPWQHRTFFWEGYACGLTARQAVGVGRATPDARFEAPGYRYMFWTGVGFWNGLAAAYHLPAVAMDADTWAQSADYDDCVSLLTGGAGFSLTSAKGGLDVEALRTLTAGMSESAGLEGALIGAGRALWFLYVNNFEALSAILEAHDAHAEPVAVGLGIAITFTQLSEPTRIGPALDRLPARWRNALNGGVRLVLAAALEDDPRIEPHLAGLPPALRTMQAQGQQTFADARAQTDVPWREALADLNRAIDAPPMEVSA